MQKLLLLTVTSSVFSNNLRQHSSGSSAQTLCAAGMYQPNVTQAQCVGCEPGNYCPGEGECIKPTVSLWSLTQLLIGI